MEKEFVPYDRALKLKKLGFDEPCFGQFYKHPTQKEEEFRLFHDCVWEDRTTSYWRTNISNHFVSAPTFSQAFRWFRDEHGVSIYVSPLEDGSAFYHMVYTNINVPFSNRICSLPSKWNTYEEAELACLDTLIEIVEGRES